jgi:hypothetical protein
MHEAVRKSPSHRYSSSAISTNRKPRRSSLDGVVVFAIIQGTASEPHAAYLDRTVPLTSEIVAHTRSVSPTEVFRMSAPCAAHGCCHFREGRCSLARRLVQLMPMVVTNAPPCALRPSGVWWLQEGIASCMSAGGYGDVRSQRASPPERTGQKG